MSTKVWAWIDHPNLLLRYSTDEPVVFIFEI